MLDTSCFISLFKSDRIRKLFVYFSFLQILVLPVYCQTYEDARAVQEGLLNFYYNNNTKLISIIPVEDQSTALSVILTMHLYSVDGFNAVTGLVEISGSLYMEWKDETMVTSIGNYNFPFKEEGMIIFYSLISFCLLNMYLHSNGVFPVLVFHYGHCTSTQIENSVIYAPNIIPINYPPIY